MRTVLTILIGFVLGILPALVMANANTQSQGITVSTLYKNISPTPGNEVRPEAVELSPDIVQMKLEALDQSTLYEFDVVDTAQLVPGGLDLYQHFEIDNPANSQGKCLTANYWQKYSDH